MITLIVSAAICILFLLVTAIFLFKKRTHTESNELMRLSETKVTAIFSLLLVAMGYFILYMKYVNQ